MCIEFDIARSRSQGARGGRPEAPQRASQPTSQRRSAPPALGSPANRRQATTPGSTSTRSALLADVPTTPNGRASSTRWSRTPRRKAGSVRQAVSFAPTLISVTRPADCALDGQSAIASQPARRPPLTALVGAFETAGTLGMTSTKPPETAVRGWAARAESGDWPATWASKPPRRP